MSREPKSSLPKRGLIPFLIHGSVFLFLSRMSPYVWRHSLTTMLSLCINSISRVRAYVCASASTFVFLFHSRHLRPMYSRRRNLKPNGSDRDRSLPRRKTARMIDCQQVGNSSAFVHRVVVDTTEITRSWNIMCV